VIEPVESAGPSSSSIQNFSIRSLHGRERVCDYWLPASGKYKAILKEEAAKHKIRIRFHNKGAQWGRAALDWKMVWIPTPARFAFFFTGLHELGHIIVGHKGGDGKPEYLWEYEAFA